MRTVEDLVVEHAEWIHKRARRYFANSFDADDLACDTIYKCLYNADRFDGTRDFKPWAVSIMENTYRTFLSRQKCVPFVGYEDDFPKPSLDRADQLLLVHDIEKIVNRCAEISVNIECVMLYVDGFSYEEIADLIGVKIGTVKSRIRNGRKMLRDALELTKC